MKRLFLLILIVCSLVFSSCGKKGNMQKKSVSFPDRKYYIGDTDPDFSAWVVEVPYFVLNNYRVEFNSKEEAIAYFKEFKKDIDAYQKKLKSIKDPEEAYSAGMSPVFSYLDNLELHTVGKAGETRYVNLEGDPNYADPDYTMSVDDMLNQLDKKIDDLISLCYLLDDEDLTKKQERRLAEILSKFDEF